MPVGECYQRKHHRHLNQHTYYRDPGSGGLQAEQGNNGYRLEFGQKHIAKPFFPFFPYQPLLGDHSRNQGYDHEDENAR